MKDLPRARKRAGEKEARNGRSDKLWREALSLELNHEIPTPEGTIKRLRLVARRVVLAAIGGDIAAAKEIGDRMDGRATQEVRVRKINDFSDLTDEELAALARSAE